jgi:hypothetical protein
MTETKHKNHAPEHETKAPARHHADVEPEVEDVEQPPEDGAVNPLFPQGTAQGIMRPTRLSELNVVARGAAGGGHVGQIGVGAVVPVVIYVPMTQSANILEIRKADGTLLFHINSGGTASTP